MNFIDRDCLKTLIEEVVNGYEKQFEEYDLKKFNSQLIDPIKLTFDAKIYKKTMEQVIEDEIHRQKDKSNNNIIGHFHQKIFKHMEGCRVPLSGFDVIYQKDDIKIFVELKNKHNTMNSSSANNTYNKFLRIVNEESDCICALVEVISNKSQNIPWRMNRRQNERIRKISIDRFYEMVTGDKNAFYKLCKEIPVILDEILHNRPKNINLKNRVIEELNLKNNNLEETIFLIPFKDYLGFKN